MVSSSSVASSSTERSSPSRAGSAKWGRDAASPTSESIPPPARNATRSGGYSAAIVASHAERSFPASCRLPTTMALPATARLR